MECPNKYLNITYFDKPRIGKLRFGSHQLIPVWPITPIRCFIRLPYFTHLSIIPAIHASWLKQSKKFRVYKILNLTIVKTL